MTNAPGDDNAQRLPRPLGGKWDFRQEGIHVWQGEMGVSVDQDQEVDMLSKQREGYVKSSQSVPRSSCSERAYTNNYFLFAWILTTQTKRHLSCQCPPNPSCLR